MVIGTQFCMLIKRQSHPHNQGALGNDQIGQAASVERTARPMRTHEGMPCQTVRSTTTAGTLPMVLLSKSVIGVNSEIRSGNQPLETLLYNPGSCKSGTRGEKVSKRSEELIICPHPRRWRRGEIATTHRPALLRCPHQLGGSCEAAGARPWGRSVGESHGKRRATAHRLNRV